MEEVLITLISAGIPAIVTLITSHTQNKLSKMHNARSSILTLILEDRIRVMNGQNPVNYQSIMYEWDEYKRNNGNSYIKDKIEEYKKIINEYEA